MVWFGPNFKGRFLRPFLPDANPHSDICPGNICPYQEYLSCYVPNFDQTFWNQVFVDPQFFGHKTFWIRILFWIQNFFGLKILLTQSFFRIKMFWPEINSTVFVQKVFWIKNFGSKEIWTKKIFSDQHFFQPKIFLDQTFFGQKFFGFKIALDWKFLGLKFSFEQIPNLLISLI